MYILALATANFSLSLSILKGNQVISTWETLASRGYDGLIHPQIKDLMEESSLRVEDLSTVVVTTGPGSFTGVRTGLAVAKGLSLALPLKGLGVSSFECVYQEARQRVGGYPKMWVALNGQREEIYAQYYDEEGQSRPPESFSPETLLRQSSDSIMIAGDVNDRLREMSQECSVQDQFLDIKPHASPLGMLAYEIIERKQENHYPLLPLYVRFADVTVPAS